MTCRVYLAPMAGVADETMRRISAGYGHFLPFTEMISAKALHYNDKKTALLFPSDFEGKMIVQIFGHEPDIMAEGAKKVAPYATEININMGCPMPKIANNGDGSALMADPERAAEIVSAVKEAVSLPVSVKFRKGIESDTAADFARVLERAGADRLYIHGRTKKELYSGKADLDTIKSVVSAVNVPVTGNGDIFSFADADNMIKKTGCESVMVGRGALGNPFIFRELDLLGDCAPPSVSERLIAAADHLALAVKLKGERRGVTESRKHIAWYLKSIPGAAKIRAELFTETDPEKIKTLIDTLKKENDI